MAHVSRWMIGEALDGASLGAAEVEAYLRARRAQGYTARLAQNSLGTLLEFLRDEGVAPMPLAVGSPPSPDEQLLSRYAEYLVNERNLVDRVVSMYKNTAALLVARHPELAAGGVIGTAEVIGFCARELPVRGPAAAANVAAGLQSFLRFLHVEGLVGQPLAQTVPPVAGRKHMGLPRRRAACAVGRLLKSCDRRTRIGRRDFAVLLLLARLGMRAGEVAALSLDDIDWREGEIVVNGKGGRRDLLPLPEDVGSAIAGYLQRGWPRTDLRKVFLRAIARSRR